MDLATLSAVAGLLSLGISVLGGIIAAIYIGRNTADKTADEAQQRAIVAMQSELSILRNKVEDTQKENSKLQQIIATIVTALKMRGLVITIQGEMVSIQDDKGASTTTRIHGTLHSATEI